MIDFIKWNWAQLLAIVVCVGALIALNAFVLHYTQGAYNVIEFLFL